MVIRTHFQICPVPSCPVSGVCAVGGVAQPVKVSVPPPVTRHLIRTRTPQRHDVLVIVGAYVVLVQGASFKSCSLPVIGLKLLWLVDVELGLIKIGRDMGIEENKCNDTENDCNVTKIHGNFFYYIIERGFCGIRLGPKGPLGAGNKDGLYVGCGCSLGSCFFSGL